MGQSLTISELKSNLNDYKPNLNNFKLLTSDTISDQAIWQHYQEPRSLVQCKYQLDNEQDYQNLLRMFIMRYRNSVLLSSQYIIVDQEYSKSLNGQFQYKIYTVRIFYERSITTLSYFKEIPQQDGLYFLGQVLNGFKIIAKIFQQGSEFSSNFNLNDLKIVEDMFHVTQDRKVKVWISDRIGQNSLPQTKGPRQFIVSKKQPGDYSIMIYQILSIISKNMYYQSEEQRQCLKLNKVGKKGISYVTTQKKNKNKHLTANILHNLINARLNTFEAVLQKLNDLLFENDIVNIWQNYPINEKKYETNQLTMTCLDSLTYGQLIDIMNITRLRINQLARNQHLTQINTQPLQVGNSPPIDSKFLENENRTFFSSSDNIWLTRFSRQNFHLNSSPFTTFKSGQFKKETDNCNSPIQGGKVKRAQSVQSNWDNSASRSSSTMNKNKKSGLSLVGRDKHIRQLNLLNHNRRMLNNIHQPFNCHQHSQKDKLNYMIAKQAKNLNLIEPFKQISYNCENLIETNSIGRDIVVLGGIRNKSKSCKSNKHYPNSNAQSLLTYQNSNLHPKKLHIANQAKQRGNSISNYQLSSNNNSSKLMRNNSLPNSYKKQNNDPLIFLGRNKNQQAPKLKNSRQIELTKHKPQTMVRQSHRNVFLDPKKQNHHINLNNRFGYGVSFSPHTDKNKAILTKNKQTNMLKNISINNKVYQPNNLNQKEKIDSVQSIFSNINQVNNSFQVPQILVHSPRKKINSNDYQQVQSYVVKYPQNQIGYGHFNYDNQQIYHSQMQNSGLLKNKNVVLSLKSNTAKPIRNFNINDQNERNQTIEKQQQKHFELNNQLLKRIREIRNRDIGQALIDQKVTSYAASPQKINCNRNQGWKLYTETESNYIPKNDSVLQQKQLQSKNIRNQNQQKQNKFISELKMSESMSIKDENSFNENSPKNNKFSNILAQQNGVLFNHNIKMQPQHNQHMRKKSVEYIDNMDCSSELLSYSNTTHHQNSLDSAKIKSNSPSPNRNYLITDFETINELQYEEAEYTDQSRYKKVRDNENTSRIRQANQNSSFLPLRLVSPNLNRVENSNQNNQHLQQHERQLQSGKNIRKSPLKSPYLQLCGLPSTNRDRGYQQSVVMEYNKFYDQNNDTYRSNNQQKNKYKSKYNVSKQFSPLKIQKMQKNNRQKLLGTEQKMQNFHFTQNSLTTSPVTQINMRFSPVKIDPSYYISDSRSKKSRNNEGNLEEHNHFAISKPSINPILLKDLQKIRKQR